LKELWHTLYHIWLPAYSTLKGCNVARPAPEPCIF